MLNSKALFLGAVAGFLIAFVPACSSPPATCGASNCATGCCDSAGKCVNPTTTAACGSVGQACVACTGTDVCTGGRCVAGGTDAGTCTPGDCRCDGMCVTGCCDTVQGTCLTGRSPTACGINGQSCQSCGSSIACNPVGTNGGACAFVDAGVPGSVGSACNIDADCAAAGAAAFCKKLTTSGTGTYAGGYCTLRCTSSGPACPANSQCINISPGYGELDQICWKSCAGPTDCRTGYACYNLGTQRVCWIAPVPLGPPSSKVSQPCTEDLQCQPPEAGFCFVPQLPNNGGPTGYLDGECSAECVTNSQCGDAGLCVGFSSNFSACQTTCVGPGTGRSTCRLGYVCQGYLVNGPGDAGPQPSTDGICRPSCSNPGPGCVATAICDSNGYCVPRPDGGTDAGIDGGADAGMDSGVADGGDAGVADGGDAGVADGGDGGVTDGGDAGQYSDGGVDAGDAGDGG